MLRVNSETNNLLFSFFSFILNLFAGKDLKGARYMHPISKVDLPFLPGGHVTAGKGTGLVHTAPAHGHDDFQIALKFKLSVVSAGAGDGWID